MKTAKNGEFSEALLSENSFEAALGKTSEAVQKIAAYQKGYHKYSLFVV